MWREQLALPRVIVEGWGAPSPLLEDFKMSGRVLEALVSWFRKFLDLQLFWGGLGHTPNLAWHPTPEVMVFLCLEYCYHSSSASRKPSQIMPALYHPPSPQNCHGLCCLGRAILHRVLAVCPDISHVTPCFSSLTTAVLSALVGWDLCV